MSSTSAHRSSSSSGSSGRNIADLFSDAIKQNKGLSSSSSSFRAEPSIRSKPIAVSLSPRVSRDVILSRPPKIISAPSARTPRHSHFVATSPNIGKISFPQGGPVKPKLSFWKKYGVKIIMAVVVMLIIAALVIFFWLRYKKAKAAAALKKAVEENEGEGAAEPAVSTLPYVKPSRPSFLPPSVLPAQRASLFPAPPPAPPVRPQTQAPKRNAPPKSNSVRKTSSAPKLSKRKVQRSAKEKNKSRKTSGKPAELASSMDKNYRPLSDTSDSEEEEEEEVESSSEEEDDKSEDIENTDAEEEEEEEEEEDKEE